MSGEYATEYTPQTIERACADIEREITMAGSLSDYLLAVQVEQGRTPAGKTELLRLQRVAHTLMSPHTNQHTPDDDAFYNGALLSSALLTKLLSSGKFKGGTYAHEFAWHAIKTRREAVSKQYKKEEILPEDIRQAIAYRTSLDLQDDAYTMAAEPASGVDELYDFAEKHLIDLYNGDEDLIASAQIGFWTPLHYIYMPPFRQDTEALLEQYPVTSTPSAHEDPAYVPSTDRLEDIVGGELEAPRLHPIHKERELIMKRFNELRAGFASNEASAPDEFFKYAMLQHQEEQLNSLNRSNELLRPGDLLQVSGTYHCIIQNGEEDPHAYKMPADTEVTGDFDSITIIEVPSLRDFNRSPNHPAGTGTGVYGIEMVPTPAIIIKNPTYIDIVEDDDGTVYRLSHQTENTAIAVPLLYKSARIARAM